MHDDRRSEVRLLCADMMDIEWKTPAGHTRRATALLEDISRAGACLQLDVPVPSGVELRLKRNRSDFTGIVKYCVYREIGYFVGVEFAPDSHWSPRAFRPQHLLDLQQLAVNARKPGV